MIRNNIADILESRGYPNIRLKRKEYAQIGCSQKEFHSWIRNEKQPDLFQLERLSNLLEIAIDQLYTHDGKKSTAGVR